MPDEPLGTPQPAAADAQTTSDAQPIEGGATLAIATPDGAIGPGTFSDDGSLDADDATADEPARAPDPGAAKGGETVAAGGRNASTENSLPRELARLVIGFVLRCELNLQDAAAARQYLGTLASRESPLVVSAAALARGAAERAYARHGDTAAGAARGRRDGRGAARRWARRRRADRGPRRVAAAGGTEGATAAAARDEEQAAAAAGAQASEGEAERRWREGVGVMTPTRAASSTRASCAS